MFTERVIATIAVVVICLYYLYVFMRPYFNEMKQCCSCERTFRKMNKDRDCPHCGSGNWVYGYIDGEDPKNRDELKFNN